MATEFSNKAWILGDFWMSHRDEEEFEDFMEYNDLGLPLAYAYSNDMVDDLTETGKSMISETWELFLASLGIEEDTGFETLDDVLGFHLHINDEYEEEEEEPETDWEEDEEEDEEESGEYLEADELRERLAASWTNGHEEGFSEGAQAEQKRVQEVILMHKRWAKEKNRASEYMFWDSAGEVLTPINFEYDEEEYRKSLEADGF